eukprot:scaffold10_cov257-Pinguiococcus_pyrenoidosus.AAC.50
MMDAPASIQRFASAAYSKSEASSGPVPTQDLLCGSQSSPRLLYTMTRRSCCSEVWPAAACAMACRTVLMARVASALRSSTRT